MMLNVIYRLSTNQIVFAYPVSDYQLPHVWPETYHSAREYPQDIVQEILTNPRRFDVLGNAFEITEDNPADPLVDIYNIKLDTLNYVYRNISAARKNAIGIPFSNLALERLVNRDPEQTLMLQEYNAVLDLTEQIRWIWERRVRETANDLMLCVNMAKEVRQRF